MGIAHRRTRRNRRDFSSGIRVLAKLAECENALHDLSIKAREAMHYVESQNPEISQPERDKWMRYARGLQTGIDRLANALFGSVEGRMIVARLYTFCRDGVCRCRNKNV